MKATKLKMWFDSVHCRVLFKLPIGVLVNIIEVVLSRTENATFCECIFLCFLWLISKSYCVVYFRWRIKVLFFAPLSCKCQYFCPNNDQCKKKCFGSMKLWYSTGKFSITFTNIIDNHRNTWYKVGIRVWSHISR